MIPLHASHATSCQPPMHLLAARGGLLTVQDVLMESSAKPHVVVPTPTLARATQLCARMVSGRCSLMADVQVSLTVGYKEIQRVRTCIRLAALHFDYSRVTCACC
jgi:hypothetical protein